MKKSIYAIVLMSLLTVTAAPVMHAEVMGTNPRPWVVPSPVATVAYTVLTFFGL